ncbi:hypothetical protein TSUD_122330 [Trifolium subterraneum]|nr:hypothetical protein TSUD_122330 [Trifolium subterraneum]
MGRRLQQTLLPRIDSCKSKFSTADEIVRHLRSTYPDYHRIKSQTLLYYVNIALLSSNNKPAGEVDQAASQLTKLSLSENNGGDSGDGDVKNVKNVPKTPMFKDLGESEKNIRELFSKAKKTAPSIIFIDAIAMRGDNAQRQMETRIVTQLLTCMDEACSSSGSSDEPTGYVLVIGATNRLDAIDSALRRPGRFALEIDVGIPDESAREAILFLHTRNCSDKLDSSVDLQK